MKWFISKRQEKESEQHRKLMQSLTFSNFFLDKLVAAYYIDLTTFTYEIFKSTRDLRTHYLSISNYYEAFSAFVMNQVHPEDRENLLSATHPDRIWVLVQQHTAYSHVFRVLGNRERRIKLLIMRGFDDVHVALGFEDVTEEMNVHQQRLLGAIPLSPDILAKAHIGLWAFELDEGKAPRMYVDDAMLRLIGLDCQVSPEETYHAWYDYIDEGSYGLVAEAVEKMTSGEHAEVQYPWHHPDGRVTIVRCGGVRNDEYKGGIRIEGTHQDVTEVIHYQNEGTKRDKDIIEILASEYTSVYYIDLRTDDLTPYTMNASTKSVFGKIFRNGISYSDAFKIYVESLVFEEDKELMLKAGSIQNILKELSDKKTFITTYRSDNEGDLHYCEMKFVKVGNDENPTAVALGFADKNETIRAELARKTIADRDAAVISGLSDDFSCVEYVNIMTGEDVTYRIDPLFLENIPNWESSTDFVERINALADTLVHPDDLNFFNKHKETNRMIIKAVKEQGAFYHNFRIIIGGETKYYQLKIVQDDKHEDYFIVGFRNVDELVRREMEYQKQLESANKSKTDFLFNMSHDIRTPMNAIIGFTQLAKKHIDDRDRTMDSLSKIEVSGNHLLDLINEVLDMSRVEAGKLRSDLHVVNVDYEATRLATICQENAAAHDVILNYENRGIVHPYVEADMLHINQIIMNILGNAIKYTPPGGTVLYTVAETECDTPGYRKYLFTVQDTGIGMTDEYLNHVYEAFSREENVSTKQIQGTGLGMAIVKKLVDFLQGDINIESRLNEGTTVKIVLQLKISSEELVKTETEELSVNLAGKKVLLVEDIDLNREIAVDILAEQGLIVDSAINGMDAVKKVETQGVTYYDFVLMDIQMPVMNGYEAAKEIKRLPGADQLPIIALSANAFEEDKKKSLEAGMDGHVSKPIMIPELVGELSKFVK